VKYAARQHPEGNGTQQISQQNQSDQSHLISGTSRRNPDLKITEVILRKKP
jgi:hypothetical protein